MEHHLRIVLPAVCPLGTAAATAPQTPATRLLCRSDMRRIAGVLSNHAGEKYPQQTSSSRLKFIIASWQHGLGGASSCHHVPAANGSNGSQQARAQQQKRGRLRGDSGGGGDRLKCAAQVVAAVVYQHGGDG